MSVAADAGQGRRISPVWGAVAGDVIGSFYERHPCKNEDLPRLSEESRFTDDTVLTVAVAHAILESGHYGASFRIFGRRYPYAGYGGMFIRWLSLSTPQPYNSWGNGSAMRVSPVGAAFDTADRVLEEARRSAEATHNHPEGIKGAQATALAVFLARSGATKESIAEEIGQRFGYNLERRLCDIRPVYVFDVSCQGSVPESVIAFLESAGTEDAIRKAISLGGDADTMACIAGGIAAAHFGTIPQEILEGVRSRLPGDLLSVLEEFDRRYPVGN